MSNHLAIATVTAALGLIVRDAAERSGVEGSVGVEFGRPTVSDDGQTTRKVQVYLYQVTPNAALCNTDLPTRGSDGNLVQRPRVALDLHYLLAFYGSQQTLEPERMLGAVTRRLHTHPLLSRQSIRGTISAYPNELSTSNLADSVERVRFTPATLSLDELSKLWSVFFQTPHALSVVYQADVVLIDAEESGPTALPVLQRGDQDRGIDTLAAAQSPFPALEKHIYVGVTGDQTSDPRPRSFLEAQLGALLILTGRNLAGDTVEVEFKHARFSEPEHPQFLERIPLAVPPTDRTATEVSVVIPNDDAAQTAWRAGPYTVSIIASNSGTTHTTNAAPLVLVPRITSIDPPNPVSRDEEGNVTLTLTASPLVSTTQNTTLLLADRAITAEPRASDVDPLQFVVHDAPVVEDAVVQLRVDDWESSIPFERSETPSGFQFADSQRVTIV